MEDERVYQFPNGEVILKDVRQLVVRPSGDHRIITNDGKLHIISKGWLAIHIIDETTKGWTV